MGLIFISENACSQLMDMLEETDNAIYRVMATDAVYDAIAAHPDIYMCHVGGTLVADEAVRTEPSLRELYEEEFSGKVDDAAETPVIPSFRGSGTTDIVFEMGSLGSEYPFDVPYNAVSTDSFFIHNTEFTAPALLDRARFAGLQIINVRQGYTKCSCIAVGDRAVITEDEGIAKTLSAYNRMVMEDAGYFQNGSGDSGDDDAEPMIDVLLIRKGYVALEGFDYGFIGGTCGRVGDTIYFNGNLSDHPDFELIVQFIERHGLRAVWTEDSPLTDIGSIIHID